jgi:hypothetical protein
MQSSKFCLFKLPFADQCTLRVRAYYTAQENTPGEARKHTGWEKVNNGWRSCTGDSNNWLWWSAPIANNTKEDGRLLRRTLLHTS